MSEPGTHTPFFTPDGDGAFTPTRYALGPWGETINGRLIGGMAARALENAHGAEGFQPARLTVDMFRPPAMTPLTIETVSVREGRRIRVADASFRQGGKEVARAAAVFLRRSEQPPGQVWSAPLPDGAVPSWPVELSADQQMCMLPSSDPADPVEPGAPGGIADGGDGGDGAAKPIMIPGWEGAARKRAWVRENRPLVEGEELSPFVRAALVADITSPLTGWGTAGLQFINVDYTLLLARLPEGPDIGLVATDHLSADGVAMGTAVIRDHRGPIGNCAITALANSQDAFRIPPTAPSAAAATGAAGRR